ncbi:MAG TPA: hypothetical protein VHC49_04010 [Mycobacteriales bacterium]|nr:hypothetical protein [Mycobacteriales bacterium]
MHWKSAVVTAALATLAVATPAGAGTNAVPAGFAPSSTSWLTAAHGFVLGYGSDHQRPALLETWDGGGSWHRLGAPDVPLPDNHDQVSVSFGNLLFGVISDGSHVYSTLDHGARWQQMSIVDAPKGRNQILKAVSYGGHFYAIVSGATSSGQGNSVGLYSAPIWSHELRPVSGIRFAGDTTGDISTKGGLAVTLGGDAGFTAKYWTSRDGTRFIPAAAPCEYSFAPALGGTVQGQQYALCTGDSGWSKSTKRVARTGSDGEFHRVGNEAPRMGFSGGIGVASGTTSVVAAAAADNVWLYGTFDGGKTWSTVLQTQPDRPIGDLSFSTARVGTVVIGAPDWGPAALYRTTDGGHTWNPLTF